MQPHELTPHDAVLVVDVQNDFCPGGSLAIDRADSIVPTVNRWVRAARERGAPVFASRDWHPDSHSSFHEHGGQWPQHCVQHTPGAEFHPELELPGDTAIVDKGTHPTVDQYSAFHDTNLADELRRRGVRRVVVTGLALDVCVRATAIDARRAGFEVLVDRDATRPVDEQTGQATWHELHQHGVATTSSSA